MYLLFCDKCLDGYVYINVDLYICISVTDIRLLHVNKNRCIYLLFCKKITWTHVCKCTSI